MFAKTQTLPFRVLRIVAVLGLTLVLLMTTDPARVPAIVLVLPFAGIFSCLYLIIIEVIRFFQPEAPEAGRSLPIYRPRLLALVIAAFPVLLLVLQSIMELNRWDILIGLTIFLLAYIFVSRGSLPSGR